MFNKLLYIVAFVLLLNVFITPAYALEVSLQLPGDPSSPTPQPSTTVTSSPDPTAQPSITPTTQPTAVPSSTAIESSTPVPTTIATPVPSSSVSPQPTASPKATTTPIATASATPAIGGTSSTAAPSAAPSSIPQVSPSPKVTVEAILKTDSKKSKPIIQDIGDNAYNTLLDSPLSFLVDEKTKDYYHPHGLSQSSTKILLSIGLFLSLFGILLVKSANLRGLSLRLKGA